MVHTHCKKTGIMEKIRSVLLIVHSKRKLVYHMPACVSHFFQFLFVIFRVMRFAVLGTGLFVFWLLLSGYWDNPLLIALGVLSSTLAVALSARMQRKYRLHSPWMIARRLPTYLIWLLYEIVKANFAVFRHIWFPGRYPITPTLKRFPIRARSRLCQTIYANSITLTPGTVTVDLSDNQVTVHAIDEGAIAELMDGEMNHRVAALEAST